MGWRGAGFGGVSGGGEAGSRGFRRTGCLAQRRSPTAASLFAGDRPQPAGGLASKSCSSCTARWTSSPRLTSSPLATGAIEKAEYAAPERVRRKRTVMGWPGPLLLRSNVSALGARLTRTLTWGGGDAWPHAPKASGVSEWGGAGERPCFPDCVRGAFLHSKPRADVA